MGAWPCSLWACALGDDMKRYERQVLLPQIGTSGQLVINQSKVLIIGAGGLGSPAALYLAGAGVGTIGLVDGDIVELTNLQRQIIYTEDQVGHSKVLAAKSKLISLNSELDIQIYPQDLDLELALKIFSSYDVIIDGTDNFKAKFLINDVALIYNLPVVYGAISGFEGQVSVFWKQQGPCYRCFYSKNPSAYIPNCAENGIMGAVAGTIGSVQAMEAIKLILNKQNKKNSLEILIGKIFILNLQNMQAMTLKLSKRPDCMCSHSAEHIQNALRQTQTTLSINDDCVLSKNDILPNQIPAYLNKENTFLLDFRNEIEWKNNPQESIQHVSYTDFMSGKIPDFIRPENTIILICKSGLRSRKASEFLKTKGFDNVLNVMGGIGKY